MIQGFVVTLRRSVAEWGRAQVKLLSMTSAPLFHSVPELQMSQPWSHCHLLRFEGVWGERTWVGALFFSLLRGSERAIHKNFRAWVT